MRAVAWHNDEQQFAVYLKPRIESAIVDRHQANGELFESYFGSDERREVIDDFLIRSLYAALRSAGWATAAAQPASETATSGCSAASARSSVTRRPPRSRASAAR